ncbi:hypothetical protein TNCV_2597561 [Trichonephila clavipes]|nr:hypothetical protein TNCV_2597561 [Trichonephila clavipes]
MPRLQRMGLGLPKKSIPGCPVLVRIFLDPDINIVLGSFPRQSIHMSLGLPLFHIPYVGEIGNGIEECADLPKQINLEVNRDDFQELLDSHIQGLTMDELIEMHEQKQDIEEV